MPPRTKELPAIAILNSIPYDVALKIASSLQAIDLCSLGSCSRFWKEFCESDCMWKALYINRWSAIHLNNLTASSSQKGQFHEGYDVENGWKELYISKHKQMAGKATSVAELVKSTLTSEESMEVGNYLNAIELLKKSELGFKDVEAFFFKPHIHVLLNLIGLHYCVDWLRIPAEAVIEAMEDISERHVCVKWSKLGRWFYGFRLRDEFHSREVSLRDVVCSDEEVLGVLRRGAVHEVIRVQICAAKPNQVSWSDQVARSSS